MTDLAPNTLTALTAELARARALHPGNANLLAALMEEVGELAKCKLEHESRERIVAEAIQVAVVALRIAEEGEAGWHESLPAAAPKRDYSPMGAGC